MAESKGVRRERVEPGIYRRPVKGPKGKPAWRYEVMWRDSDGRLRRKKAGGDVKAARVELGRVRAKMADGQRVAPRTITFGEAAEAFMASQRAQLRPSTQAAYRSSLDIHLLPAWGKVRLDRIGVDVVAGLVERMQTVEYRRDVVARRGGERKVTEGYRTWTIRGVLTVAGRVFEYAARRMDWAGQNPVRQLTRSERPKGQRHERRILTRDELLAVIDHATWPYNDVIATAGMLGTRLGETLGLRWENLDLDERRVEVTHQIDRRGERVELKTERSRRVVDLPSSLAERLRVHKLRTPQSLPGDLVFAAKTGGPLEQRNVAQRGLARAVKRAVEAGKVDGSKRAPTFHELRHAHASAFIAAGGDVVELSARLGHRDPAITASVYSHEFEKGQRSQERRARLDAMYGALPLRPALEVERAHRGALRAAGGRIAPE